jgi:hypothetical protein
MKTKAFTTAALAVVAYSICSNLALGQAPQPVILIIDTENVVEYQGDVADPAKFGQLPGVTPPNSPKGFPEITNIGDIVAVNGQPAKGTLVGKETGVLASPAPAAGFAIADVTRRAFRNLIFEILKADGTPIGTIMTQGFNGGNPPPGAPLSQGVANFAIIGGTGAFLGARGQGGQARVSSFVTARAASMAEDPANRRINGGGQVRFILHVIPMYAPEIAATPSGPAVTHSIDFTVVTASKPAAPGEFLSVFATGLGPTVPGVDPGQPFPATPLAVVNSDVVVTVNGKSAQVIGAAGLSGALDGYQVNFRLPTDTPKGAASIQITAAWITGPAVSISVQ